jgi:hypothetical protein
VRTLLPGLVCLGTCVFLDAQTVKSPAYTETSIIDFATGRPNLLTLNALAVIHGENLSYLTRARLESDFQGGRYPAALPEANVAVKIRGSAVPVEFAFSLDNLVPIGIATWYTLQPDDRDAGMLATLCGVLRSDRSFFAAYAETADRIRAEIGLCPRQPDGHFADIDTAIPAVELWQRAADFPDRLTAALGPHAVQVLAAKGYSARLNEVGHVAVRM